MRYTDPVIKFGRPVAADVESRLPRLEDAFSRDPRIDAVWLCGSRARGEADTLSDVDLAILLAGALDQPVSGSTPIDLLRVATNALGTDEVGLHVVNTLPVALRYSLLNEARLLWARTPERPVDAVAQTVRAYLDFKPYLDRYDRELFRQAASGSLR